MGRGAEDTRQEVEVGQGLIMRDVVKQNLKTKGSHCRILSCTGRDHIFMLGMSLQQFMLGSEESLKVGQSENGLL